MLARLLDVPQEDTGQLIAWGNEFVGNTDPDFAEVRADLPESATSTSTCPSARPPCRRSGTTAPTLKELARRRRRHRPGQSILANRLPEDGVPLSDAGLQHYFTLLVIAGQRDDPARDQQLDAGADGAARPDAGSQASPALIPGAVEELLRWASPVYHFRRTATRDAELGGKQIKEGDKVVMWFASGNRDEPIFADPYAIDVTRQPVDHMTFGKGSPHLCLGNNLARMEIRLMFEELLPRLDEIELAGDIRRVRSNFVNGIKAFPVRVVPT